ncbi:MAG: bifunctional phosphoribosylaminoimidazolecarboxamide formyltransferase/IMP cyclohydrolase [Gammaproteobacteria bacterium]|nr:bifunctional phosphoribosylaminoimidazolecarboxamide formyltransferase/IMP cyclohydrolase [Gammaproteobacteria bacterium]
MIKIGRALLSVSDKRGLAEFGRFLNAQKTQLLSTGGTAKLLADTNIAVTEVADYTKFPEIMDGRVKTLHPKIHGGLLGRRGIDDATMAEHGIDPIDLLVVNLYPFRETIAAPNCTQADAIENIDIGGPAMLRAAAKNHTSVCVVVDPDDYPRVIEEMKTNDGCLSEELCFELAAKAFAHTAAYDRAIARYLSSANNETAERQGEQSLPSHLSLEFDQQQMLRYGENPHQQAAFYRDPNPPGDSLGGANQHQGKKLSYNNIADTDAAWECVRQFAAPACVIVKHANPCGVAVASDSLEAYRSAYATDPTSAFGGIIAFNQSLSADAAQEIIDQQFVEVIIAPDFSAEALSVLSAKPNIRVLSTASATSSNDPALELKKVSGGLLVQTRDERIITASDLSTMTRREPTTTETDDLLFAWSVVKFVKSNAIVFCRDGQTLGVGAGQMSRVYSARIAAIKAEDAGLPIKDAVMASDAFFPFRDTVDRAAEMGIAAIIQPGGSMRDQEVIDAADEHGICMVFTGVRHFRH